MKEIEVKARLQNKEKVFAELEKLGCIFSEPIKQIDTVYTKIIGGVKDYLKNKYFARIRENNNGLFIFTVKIPKAIHENLVKKEHETEVKNAKELEQILFMTGHQIANQVIKIRRTAKFKDYEICLDEVEGLGNFIELERMAEDDSDDAFILKEMQSFLISLGISPDGEVKKGYDILILEKLTK